MGSLEYMGDMEKELFEAFPALKPLDESALAMLKGSARSIRAPQDTVIFREGGSCQNYVLVLNGSVRVQMISESGREIVLYRVERGQTCILTTASLMAGADYAAQGIAESDVSAIALPAANFLELMGRSSVFRRFVFNAFGTRISDLLMLLEEVAFGRIDVRLAQLLIERCGPDGAVRATHQQLAVELGTAREVVSRQLKEFERRSWVSLHRGYIEVGDVKALRDLS
jgi:CRP/FNR family transcriptional regulator